MRREFAAWSADRRPFWSNEAVECSSPPGFCRYESVTVAESEALQRGQVTAAADEVVEPVVDPPPGAIGGGVAIQ
jgi:hypothetical protein